MAIRKTLKIATQAHEDINVSCYIRIVGVSLSKDQAVATYHVCRNDNMKVIYERSIPFSPDVSGTTWAQAYGALKKTDEFSGAEDC